MRTQLKNTFPETALERILDALEHELIEAGDADVLEAAHDLGMQPQMRGSAAFLGLRYASAMPRAEDFFDARWMPQPLNDPRRVGLARVAPHNKVEPPPATSRAARRVRPARRRALRPPKEPRGS